MSAAGRSAPAPLPPGWGRSVAFCLIVGWPWRQVRNVRRGCRSQKGCEFQQLLTFQPVDKGHRIWCRLGEAQACGLTDTKDCLGVDGLQAAKKSVGVNGCQPEPSQRRVRKVLQVEGQNRVRPAMDRGGKNVPVVSIGQRQVIDSMFVMSDIGIRPQGFGSIRRVSRLSNATGQHGLRRAGRTGSVNGKDTTGSHRSERSGEVRAAPSKAMSDQFFRICPQFLQRVACQGFPTL
jgi:hypothetical protein